MYLSKYLFISHIFNYTYLFRNKVQTKTQIYIFKKVLFPDATFLMLTHLLWTLRGPFSFRFPLVPPDSWVGAGFERGRVLSQLLAHSPCFLWSPCIPACATLNNFFFLATSQKKNIQEGKRGSWWKAPFKKKQRFTSNLDELWLYVFQAEQKKKKREKHTPAI